MSRSNDPGHYFQTTDSLATTERKAAKSKNKHGDPIKLSSKILAAHVDPWHATAVYVAEAAGDVKRVDLETHKITKVFSQSNAPITCLAVCAKSRTLFAGSWDKTVYAIPVGRTGDVRRLQGHSDFVKCLLATSLNGQPILLSGGADSNIIVWDTSEDNFGKHLHKLKGHSKALADLTCDPTSIPNSIGLPEESFTLFSASSDREIRRWRISTEAASETSDSLERPIRTHETSVYKLRWDGDGDLWTASADKTARHLVRTRDWEADTTLQHPDFVRDVVVFEDLGLVSTACRDEEIRVWEISSGKLVCTYTGHYEEVTALVPIFSQKKVVSVSIDGTLRQWSLERNAMTKHQEEIAKELNGQDVKEEKEAGGVLTAEEEAELAELMDSDDE